MSTVTKYQPISARRKRKAPPTPAVLVVSTPAKKARTVAQIPRGFVTALAGDSKYFDSADAANAVNTTGYVQHLDIVPQGTTVITRVGKSWQNTNIQIRLRLENDSTATRNQVAMYLVWDRQPNKALAAITDLLDTASPTSFMKRENKGRFLVIKKWQRLLIGAMIANPLTGREALIVDKWVKLPAECIAQSTTADTTGAIGNRVTGALLFFTVGNTAAGTADVGILGNFRVGFKDI